MVWYLLVCVVLLVISGKVSSISSPVSLTREVGEDVVFMVNGTAMSEATWGVRDGNTNNLNPRLYRAFNPGGAFPDTQINSTGYAGRVSFVGDLSKGQAWFKITNLNVSDTKQYLAKINLLGESSYRYITTRLTVKGPVTTTTAPSSTSTSLPTGIVTQEPTNAPPTNPPILKNLTATLIVYRVFSSNMIEKNSLAFRNFSYEFEAEIIKAYKDQEEFESVEVINLGKGSIIVTFIVFFKSEISREDACAPLENRIKDGTLGSLKIVPGSLRCSKPKPSSPRPPGARAALHPGIIAGVAVVGVLAIAGLVIAILFVCRKKSSRKDYRSSTGGQGYEMDGKHGEPEEQYASVQKPAASSTKQPHNQQIPQYAAVDKSKKTKKNTRESGELVYAELDHGRHASVGTRPPSDRPISGSDTMYADIQSDRQKQRYPPPQYGNMQDMSYA